MKEHHGVEICTTTASLWLHDMGFSYKQFSKGVYFDGHEREDVVKDRKLYLETLSSHTATGCGYLTHQQCEVQLFLTTHILTSQSNFAYYTLRVLGFTGPYPGGGFKGFGQTPLSELS